MRRACWGGRGGGRRVAAGGNGLAAGWARVWAGQVLGAQVDRQGRGAAVVAVFPVRLGSSVCLAYLPALVAVHEVTKQVAPGAGVAGAEAGVAAVLGLRT